MATLASLVIKILGDTAGLDAAVNKAGAALDRLGTKGSTANKVLKATAIGGGGVLLTGLAASVNVAAQFEQKMDAVGAVSQATDKQMQGLNKTALQLGKDTSFSTREIAAAMEILAANGVSAEDIIGGAAKATATLAAAGGTDLALAADTASTAMTVWSLKTQDMTDLVNRLAGAANVSRFGVDDMSQAIAMGGGAAASAGVEYQDFLTAIAATASSFSSGSDAGTSFKQFLNGLTPNSASARKALASLGLMTEQGGTKFFDAAGKMKSMAEISELLSNATKNLTEEEKAKNLEVIFGSDALRMAAALSKVTGDEFTAMSDKMKNSDATLIAAQRMDNAAGAMERLTGTIEALQIELTARFLPVIQRVADFLAAHPKLIMALAAVITGVVILAMTAWTVVTIAHAAATLGLTGANAALLLSMAPWLILLAAIVVAGYLLIKNWDAISEAAVRFGTAVKDKALGALQAVLDWLGNNWPIVATLIAGPFAPLVALATDAFGVRSALEGAFKWIVKQFKKLEEIKVKINMSSAGPLGSVPTGISVTLPDFRAAGGPVSARTPYIVGEQGPELFVPSSSGSIISNKTLGAGRSSGSSGGRRGPAADKFGITIRGNVIVNNNGAQQDADGAIKALGYMMKAQARSRGVALAV